MKFWEETFLSQLISESARKDALLDLLFVYREGLMGDATGDCFLDYSGHEMVEFKTLSVTFRGKRTAELLPCSSEVQTLSYSGRY